MSFQIKTEKFNGPLDLLLQLIEQEELDITQINLAQVTDQYLKHIEDIVIEEVERAAEYLVVASQLLLIKSKILLPEMKLDEDEEEDAIDLEECLKEYKRFKEVAMKLKEITTKGERSFDRQVSQNLHQFSMFKPPEQVSADKLKSVFEEVLKNIPKEEQIGEEFLEKTVTMEEKMEQIQNHLQKSSEIELAHILKESNSHLELVVTFLAILEMIKRKIIQAIQPKLFEPIKVVLIETNG
ncbi:segregation and condensation protein A [Patescibacteria group bacterium]